MKKLLQVVITLLSLLSACHKSDEVYPSENESGLVYYENKDFNFEEGDPILRWKLNLLDSTVEHQVIVKTMLSNKVEDVRIYGYKGTMKSFDHATGQLVISNIESYESCNESSSNLRNRDIEINLPFYWLIEDFRFECPSMFE